MKIYLYSLSILLMLPACNRQVVSDWLDVLIQADSLSETAPDRAYALLRSIPHPETLRDADFAYWCLLSGRIFNHRTDASRVFLPAMYYERACSYYMQHGSAGEKSYIRLNLGRAYQEAGKYDQAMRIYVEALEDTKQWQEYNVAGMICCYIGDVYSVQNSGDKSREKYHEAIGYFERAGNQRTLALTLSDIGFAYVLDGNPAEGLSYLLQADSIADYLQDATLSSISRSLGVAYVELKEFALGQAYLLKALQRDNSKADSTATYYALSDIYIAAGDYQKAREVLEKGTNDWTMDGTHYQWHLIEKGEGNLEKALMHLEAYQDAIDSTQMVQNRMRVLEIEQQYNLEYAENQKNKARMEAQRYLIFLLMALIVLLLTLVLYQLMRRRKNKIIDKQREALSNADITIFNIETLLKQEKENLEELSLLMNQANEERDLLLANQQQKIDSLYERLFTARLEKITQASAIGQKIRKATEKVMPGGVKALTAAEWDALIKLFRTTFPTLDAIIWDPGRSLSESEIQFSMLAFFNLEAKQEASLMHIQPSSAFKQRTRLRQKLQLEDRISLFDFFRACCMKPSEPPATDSETLP